MSEISKHQSGAMRFWGVVISALFVVISSAVIGAFARVVWESLNWGWGFFGL